MSHPIFRIRCLRAWTAHNASYNPGEEYSVPEFAKTNFPEARQLLTIKRRAEAVRLSKQKAPADLKWESFQGWHGPYTKELADEIDAVNRLDAYIASFENL